MSTTDDRSRDVIVELDAPPTISSISAELKGVPAFAPPEIQQDAIVIDRDSISGASYFLPANSDRIIFYGSRIGQVG